LEPLRSEEANKSESQNQNDCQITEGKPDIAEFDFAGQAVFLNEEKGVKDGLQQVPRQKSLVQKIAWIKIWRVEDLVQIWKRGFPKNEQRFAAQYP